MRKTIKVENIRNRINKMLAVEKDKNTKSSLCCIIEDVLMQTGNYQGFRWNMTTEEARAVRPDDPTYYDRYYF